MRADKKINILFTSVGRRSYLVHYFKEVLGEQGEIHVANSSAISPAFQAADYAVVTPLIYDDDYIPFLLEYCKSRKINAIIPLFDVDLPILSKNKGVFSEIGVTVIVSDPQTIAVCNDKWNTYKFLIKNHLPAPRTFIALEDALTAIRKKEINYPVIVKPRWGMGSLAIYEAESEEELRIFYNKTRRKIFKTYLKYESESAPDECVLIQEKIVGQEYGLDVINDLKGCYQTTIVKRKYAMRSGETDCAITIDNEELREIGKCLGKTLHHIGNLDVDAFVNERGGIYILEMNARFGGGYPFSHKAGVDLPRAILQWLCGEDVQQELLKALPGVMAMKDINIVEITSN